MATKSSIQLKGASIFILLSSLIAAPLGAQTYKVSGSIAIGGSGGWDYLATDSANRRMYISHGPQVEVVDLSSDKLIGKISGLGGISGIAIAPEFSTGFLTDGGAGQVVAFDLKTLLIKKRIAAGDRPDGVVYDPSSKRVFDFNGRSKDATVIDAATGTVAGTIPLPGKPEFPVADGRGFVYDNIEDKSEIVKIDSKSMKVVATWPLTPCEEPSGLAIDTAARRLFAVCDNKLMAVVNTETGKVVATPAIGEGPDAAAYDPSTHLAFSSNGESGTITVVHEAGHDKFDVVQTIQTVASARTMALDLNTHKLYLSSGKHGPPPAATAANPHPYPSVVSGSFKILVVTP